MLFRRLRCSFCRRADKDVEKLVAGRSGYICDRCANEVIRIMNAAPPAESTAGENAKAPRQPVADWNRTWHFASASTNA
jgi:ATP-dependent protease Clp ATPase subunit